MMEQHGNINGSVHAVSSMNGQVGGGSSLDGSVQSANASRNYEGLINKPSIEGVELVGNKLYSDLNLNYLTNIEIENILT